jgi:CRP/FNR family transcriptional regulator, cyclic AMP receptor protein
LFWSPTLRLMSDVDPAVLQQLPLFADLSLADCERIASWCYTEDLAPGRVIAAEGAHDYAFFILLDGSATVTHGDTVVRTLGPGDHFGEKAILEKGIRSATVTADTQVTALVMMGFHFRELEATYPSVAATVHAHADQYSHDDEELESH